MVQEKGFNFAGKHLTEDFGFYIKSSQISPPKKRIKQLSLPYRNGNYSIGNYGEPIFENRELRYVVDLAEGSITANYNIKAVLENWLLVAEKGRLEDDSYPGYYFNAECVEINESESEDGEELELEIVFEADPYRIKEDEEGNPLWDTFNFNTDYLQPELLYNITDTQTIQIHSSASHLIHPVIENNAPITIVFNGRTYSYTAGSHKDYRILFSPGLNILQITGEAEVRIRINAEVL